MTISISSITTNLLGRYDLPILIFAFPPFYSRNFSECDDDGQKKENVSDIFYALYEFTADLL